MEAVRPELEGEPMGLVNQVSRCHHYLPAAQDLIPVRAIPSIK